MSNFRLFNSIFFIEGTRGEGKLVEEYSVFKTDTLGRKMFHSPKYMKKICSQTPNFGCHIFIGEGCTGEGNTLQLFNFYQIHTFLVERFISSRNKVRHYRLVCDSSVIWGGGAGTRGPTCLKNFSSSSSLMKLWATDNHVVQQEIQNSLEVRMSNFF